MEALVALGIWLGMREKGVAMWLGRSTETIRSHLKVIYTCTAARGLDRTHVAVALSVERVIRPDDGGDHRAGA